MIFSNYECVDCERIVMLRNKNAIKFPTYHNNPVPALGLRKTGLLILGLAPGLHGANATGIPFNGDYAGKFLNQCLEENGFRLSEAGNSAKFQYCITNIEKCLPPSDRPSQSEVNNCIKYLKKEISFVQPKIILCLGVVAHNGLMKVLEVKKLIRFQHGKIFKVGQLSIIDSYHPSKLNIFTGRLSKEMLGEILTKIRKEFEKAT